MYENSELKAFQKNVFNMFLKCLGEISSNWPNNLLGINMSTKLLNLVDNRC